MGSTAQSAATPTDLSQKAAPQLTAPSIDPDEVAMFSAMADSWWNPTGPFKPLHVLNPTRVAYIKDRVEQHFGLTPDPKSLAGKRLIDIGCGGGLVAESMRALGADVTAIDASEKNIKTAAVHAARSELDITYLHTSAEAMVEVGAQFDIIINMEVVEHVADVGAYLKACADLLAPGGIMLMSTLNRTLKSYVFAIVGAEYVLRWLPKGTHDWSKFITPRELATMATQAGLQAGPATGYVFNPLGQSWSLSDRDFSVNYAMQAVKP